MREDAPLELTKWGRRFALAGFLISLLFLLFWILDDKFNFFHLPTSEEVIRAPYGYPPSVLRAVLQKANLFLCPPTIATSFAGMDLGGTANLILGAIAVLLNTVLYFVIGMFVRFFWSGIRRSRSA
jgi:hypothetical protein